MNNVEMLDCLQSALHLTKKISDFLAEDFDELDTLTQLRFFILFRMEDTGNTIYEILNKYTKDVKFVDYSSAAVLTRSIFESYRQFYYLTSEPGVNDSEFEFRYYIFESYGIIEKKKMIEQLSTKTIDLTIYLEWVEKELNRLEKHIYNNAFYKQLEIDNKQNKAYESIKDKLLFSNSFIKVIEDKKGCFIRHRDILSKRFIAINPIFKEYEQKINSKYDFLYGYLSSFVHISPLSIYSHPFPVEADGFNKIVLPVVFYLSIVAEEILNDFPEFKEYLQIKTNYPQIVTGINEFIKWVI